MKNTLDPFYSKENIKRLKQAIADADAGIHMEEHELIEDCDYSKVIDERIRLMYGDKSNGGK